MSLVKPIFFFVLEVSEVSTCDIVNHPVSVCHEDCDLLGDECSPSIGEVGPKCSVNANVEYAVMFAA